MSSSSPARDELVQTLLAELGRVSAYSVLFSQAVADRAGLHPTDLESLDILHRDGPLTAGRLAELTGLSTGGAITALIDRLERLGYARRERDTTDRRRVIIRAVPEQAEPKIGPLYAGMDRSMRDLIAVYSDEDIALIIDFLTRANTIVQDQITRVRAGANENSLPAEEDMTSSSLN